MKFLHGIFFAVCFCALCACDLQPKILSLPDSVGEFISARYPALLADPDNQPEIYNSAASDYGVYAAPELYGVDASTDDYVMYASVNDYIVPPQNNVRAAVTVIDASDADADGVVITTAHVGDGGKSTPVPSEPAAVALTDDILTVPGYDKMSIARAPRTVTVVPGDTLYSIAKKYNMTTAQLAAQNNLTEPYALYAGQKIIVPGDAMPGDAPAVVVAPKTNTVTRVDLQTITVEPGDTLYSLSRRYATPVNDLAVMNNLTVPFALYAGQQLKVPDLKSAPVIATSTPVSTSVSAPVTKVVTEKKVATSVKAKESAPQQVSTKPQAAPQKKISSDPGKALPKISARSSSKFSWPVNGKILSQYGKKPDGLVNDGINIGASRGTAVRAAENGVVAYAGNEVKGMGNLVIIQHSGGWMTVYAHMDDMSVRRGTRVSVGQKIGTIGTTGKVDQPQLHFEIRKGTKAYNPTAYLKKK